MEYYTRSLEHVLAELDRLDLLIRAQVWRARELRKGERDGLPAFYIAEDEVEALLEQPVGSPFWARLPLPPDTQQALQNTLDEMGSLIHARTAESLRRGIDLRLARLGYRLGLSAFDLDVLLVCLAPEIDRRYERLYAYLQDDVTRKHPSVALVLDLLCPPLETKIALRQHLAPAAPLRHHGLLHILDDPNLRQPSLLGTHLQLDPRIADYLLGGDQIDERLQPYARLIEPQVSLDNLIMSSDFKARLSDFTRAANGMSPIVYFQGPYGAGKQSIAEGLCKQAEISLLLVDGRRFPIAKAEDFETLVRLASREALLQEAALYWDGFDVLLDEEQVTRRELLLQTLRNHSGLVYLAGNTLWEASNMEQARGFVRVEFPPPTYEQRLRLWRQTLRDDALDLAAVAAKFRFTGGQIQDAGATARGLAQWRDRSTSQVSDSDLYAACRLQSNRKLATLAQKVTPHYTWDNIVLPPEQIEQLRALCHQVRYRDLVYETWGFDRKLALGKGPSTLFAGPPGTGKTMAADIIAGELGLDLYKIDLSHRGQQIHRRDGEKPRADLRRGREPAMLSCSSMRPTPCSASAPRCATPMTATPISRSATCCRRWMSTKAWSSWPLICARIWTRPLCGVCALSSSFRFPRQKNAAGSGRGSGPKRPRAAPIWIWIFWPTASRSLAGASAASPSPAPSWPPRMGARCR